MMQQKREGSAER